MGCTSGCHVSIPFPSPKVLHPVLCPVFPTAGCLMTRGSEMAGSTIHSSSVPLPRLLFEFQSFPLIACRWFPTPRKSRASCLHCLFIEQVHQGGLRAFALTPFSSPPSGHSEKLHSKNPPCTSDALRSYPLHPSFLSGTLDCLA